MKFIIIALLAVACSLPAFAQYGVSSVNNQAQPLQMADHPQHADYHEMRAEQNLLGGNTTTGHGSLPLWEFGHPKPEVSLGEYARAIRKAEGKVTILDKGYRP